MFACSSICPYSITDYINDQWFSKERKDIIKHVAIGIIAGLATFLLMAAAMYTIESIVGELQISQDAMKIFNLFQSSHPLAHAAWRGAMGIFIVFLGPVEEEILFRGLLNDKIHNCQGDEQQNESSVCKKVVRVAAVALIFGACHFSPFQTTVSNVVIVAGTSVIGLVLGILKENRKDLSASIAAHMTYNLCALATI